MPRIAPIAFVLLAVLAVPLAAEGRLHLRASDSSRCSKAYTQADHEQFARKVWNRDRVSKAAKKRLVTMRTCQHSSAASKNARRLNRRLRKRYKARKAATPYSGSAIPAYIIACESGGSYTAVNPSSGAYGKYQIMPFHWSSGICRGLSRSPRDQDICAARIWESSGPGAWDCA